MDLPLEIVSEIISHSLAQVESDISRSNRSTMIKDVMNLGGVSKYFRAEVNKVRYKDTDLFDGISFRIRSIDAFEVSFVKFNEYMEFVKSNGLLFDVSKSIKQVSLCLESNTLNAFFQMSDQSQFELDGIFISHYDEESLESTVKMWRSLITRIKTLREVRLNYNDYDDIPRLDELEFYPTRLNIEEIHLDKRNIEQYGMTKFNAYQSLKNIGFDVDYELNNSHFDGFDLKLQVLQLTLYPSLSLSKFNCCINSLTSLYITIHNTYTDFLSFLPKLLNLTLLYVSVCDQVTADFFPTLLELARSTLLNLRMFTINREVQEFFHRISTNYN